jgi:hypothetical protein
MYRLIPFDRSAGALDRSEAKVGLPIEPPRDVIYFFR